MSYVETWKYCFQNQWYDFLLVDNSLVQFRIYSLRPLKVSYAFLDCPFGGTTYEDFIQTQLELDVNDVGDSFRQEYADYLLTCPPKPAWTPIRYDYDSDAYMPGIHPASHMHFGYGNGIRVATLRILKPLSFVLFVVRQCYGQAWRDLNDHENMTYWCRNIRDSLDLVDRAFMDAIDQREMFFH